MDQSSADSTMTTRDLLIEDLADFGIGAGVLAAPPELTSPARTAESDLAEAAAMHVLRPLLRNLSKRRFQFL
ncbi:hypothetical protein [Burkholderia lata]|uniref:Uncharacterized protein n=2 Tax=Burkholderia cepacia complex TaxID=87882 RepID=A0A6P2XTT4_BURL3|nr:hypothetical protein [Burkholderia lata]VWD11565.1 hypothetical protein BLA18109_05264 [Burkholderia lata]